MRVVDVRGVQSHLSVELVEPTEQTIGAPLRDGRSCLQDLEADTIHSISFRKFFILTYL
jgi:hypothetical protein